MFSLPAFAPAIVALPPLNNTGAPLIALLIVIAVYGTLVLPLYISAPIKVIGFGVTVTLPLAPVKV